MASRVVPVLEIRNLLLNDVLQRDDIRVICRDMGFPFHLIHDGTKISKFGARVCHSLVGFGGRQGSCV